MRQFSFGAWMPLSGRMTPGGITTGIASTSWNPATGPVPATNGIRAGSPIVSLAAVTTASPSGTSSGVLAGRVAERTVSSISPKP